MNAKLTRGLEESMQYGRISKIVLPDKSRIYISKKGWNLVSPKKTNKEISELIKRLQKEKCLEILLPYSEINLAIAESIKQGYTSTHHNTKDTTHT